MTAGRHRLQVHVGLDTMVALRDRPGMPLVLLVQSQGLDVEFVFPQVDGLASTSVAVRLADRARALLDACRARTSGAVAS